MKYIPFLILSLSCLFAPFADAQPFKKGHVFLQSGDTLTGYIADGSYESLSRSITFKLNRKNEDLITYPPNEIRGFQFLDGDYFTSESVNFSTQIRNGETKDIAEARFLHRLYVNDKSTLYELNDGRVQPLFLQKGNGPLKLLCLDQNGNKAYLEELAILVHDCESVIVPDDLPLDAKAIQVVLSSYEQCGQVATLIPIPQAMAWVGVAVPAWSLRNGYNGLGKSFQMEFRLVAEGFFSNVSIGAEFLHLDANQAIKEDWGRDVSSIKHRELSLKASFFLNAMKGHLRPYGFLQWTTTTFKYSHYSQYSGDSSLKWNISNREFDNRGIRPGVGIHAQWRRHFIRLEMPIYDQVLPRIGYGYAF